MNRIPARAVIGGALVVGLLCLVIPAEVWLRLATLLSPDRDIGNPGVRSLVARTGQILAAGFALTAAGVWQRGRITAGGTWLLTCPPRPWVVVLLIAVAVPRLAWMQAQHTVPHTDLAWYHTHAQNLIDGAGYAENGKPTAFWPIGYPLFLAVLYASFGVSLAVVKGVQLLLACLTAILLWHVARRVADEATARIAALIYALCPSTVMFTELVSTEILFATLLVGIWAVVLPAGGTSWPRRILLGLLVGAGILVKPVLLPWPAFALVLVGRRQPRVALRDAVVVYVVALCVIAPWTVRNYRVFGRFVLVSTNAGFNLYVGNGPGATGAVRTLPPDVWAPFYAMANEAERDAALRGAAGDAIRADPGRFVALIPAKLAALYRDDSSALRWAGSAPGTHWSPVRALLIRLSLDGYYYGCLALSAVWLVRRGWRPHPHPWLVLLSWAGYITVVHAVYYGDPRYHQVLWPLLALTAAGGLRGDRKAGGEG